MNNYLANVNQFPDEEAKKQNITYNNNTYNYNYDKKNGSPNWN